VETKRTTLELQPTLKGSLLELRPLRASDFQLLYAVASDPLIWEQHPVMNRWKEDVFRKFFQESLGSGGALTAVDCKLGKVIGSSRFHGYGEQESEIEIREFELAHSKPRHLAPQPKTSRAPLRTGLDGLVDSLLATQHLMLVFRRSLPNGPPRTRLNRLANRLTKILTETQKLQTA
jgi:hypothetical protein